MGINFFWFFIIFSNSTSTDDLWLRHYSAYFRLKLLLRSLLLTTIFGMRRTFTDLCFSDQLLGLSTWNEMVTVVPTLTSLSILMSPLR